MGIRFSAVPAPKILNYDQSTGDQKTGDITRIAEDLERCMRRLQGEFLADNGKAFDYAGMRTSPQFVEFKDCVALLQYADLMPISGTAAETMRKAFFINVYSLLTVHALVELAGRETGLPGKMLEIKDFWRSFAYNIGGLTFSLDDIEHGILRGNKAHPASLLSRSYFNSSDARLRLALSECDPRIHFVLNCGAASCPRISVLNAQDSDRMEKTLEDAAKVFCDEDVLLDVEKKHISLSKIFYWYGQDFGSSEKAKLSRISGWLDEEKKVLLRDLMGSGARIVYKPYDWSINNTPRST